MTYEGNKRVRYYKLQKLWAEYDAMKMADDESIDEFHSRLINMTNEFARLGDPFAEHTIVKKFLRALPLRFRGKATIIQEVQDLNTFSLDELVANLQKFERYHKLKKLWTEHDAMAMADDESINDFHSRLIYMTNEFARLGVPFAEDTIVKKFLRALPLSFQDKVTAIEEFRDLDTYPLNELLWNLQAYEMSIKERKLKSVASHVMRKEEKKTKDTKPRFTQKRNTKDKPRCFECRGIGHIAADCANLKLKARPNKAKIPTWSDSESETHSDGGEEYLALGIYKVVLDE